MNFNIKDRTILLTLVGSRGYGTFTDESDWDYKGICVPPINTYLSNYNHFEQYENKLDIIGFPITECRVPPIGWYCTRNAGHEGPCAALDGFGVPINHECVIYDIKKYFQLAALCNPNILEILFSDEDKIVYSGNDWIAGELIDNRNIFLSQKVRHSYAGYAHAQLKKIRTHRAWLLLDNAPKMPEREEFGLPDQPLIGHEQLKAAISMVNKQIETWTMHPEKEIPVTVLNKARESIYDLVAWVIDSRDYDNIEPAIVNAATYKLGFDDNFSEYIVKQKKYNSALKHFQSYTSWSENRNPKRKILEAKAGYDTKHAMHLVRLLRTCEELMTIGKLIVTRPDAEELKSIRDGGWTYDKLEEYTNLMNDKLDILYSSSVCPLPYSPDFIKIDNLLTRIIWSSADL